MTFLMGTGRDGAAATLTIAHDHEDGAVDFALECPHGRSTTRLNVDLGAMFPDEPEPAALTAQAGLHDRAYGCGCAIRFLVIQQQLSPSPARYDA